MPVVLRALGYKIYFSSFDVNEPIHVHVAKGATREPSTKIWLLEGGSVQVAKNVGTPKQDLEKICAYLENNWDTLITAWEEFTGIMVRFYK